MVFFLTSRYKNVYILIMDDMYSEKLCFNLFTRECIFTLVVEVGSNVHQCKLLPWDPQPTKTLCCIETLFAGCYEFSSRMVYTHINPWLPQVTPFRFPQIQETGRTLRLKIDMWDVKRIKYYQPQGKVQYSHSHFKVKLFTFFAPWSHSCPISKEALCCIVTLKNIAISTFKFSYHSMI